MTVGGRAVTAPRYRQVAAPSTHGTRPDQLVLLAFFGVVLIGGLNAIAVKQTVHELAPFWGAAIRFLAAASIMAVIVFATRRRLPRGRSLVGAMIYGTVGFAASYGFVYVGIRETPAGTTAVLLALTPLMTFGLAIAHRQEAFHPRGLIGALVALVGVAIVFVDQLSANVPLGSLILLVLGVACVAETGVIVKWIPRSDPFGTNAVAMLTGGVLLLGLSVFASESWALPAQTTTWLAVGYLVVLGSVVMFALYVFTLERWTASTVSYMTLLLPFVTISAAAVLTREAISPSFAIGGAVVLAGVYIGAFSKRRPQLSSASSQPECLPIDACVPEPPALEPSPAAR
jgi:drug/metabolite transporter (DMT)-like permease